MIWFDCETFSRTPIANGTYRYASDAEVMVITYALDEEPVKLWDVTAGGKMPGDLEYLLRDTDELITAHQSMFDRNVLRLSHNIRIEVPIERWRDTLVQALAHSLPGGLDKVCEILDVDQDQRKLKSGKSLIQLFCRPRPKNSKIDRATRLTHPAEWAEFLDYAKADISAMRAINKKLPNWNYKDGELALWHLDQEINDAGVLIDIPFATAAIEAAEKAKDELAKRTVDITNGEVQKATQRDAMLLHILKDYGVDLPDMKASTLERRINDPELPLALRELLDIRLQASMGSSSKYKAMLKAVNADGYCRGLLQFCGANRTGRWAGRTVQPQNMFRPPKHIKKQWDFAIEAITLGCADLFFDNVMEATAATARGAIISPPGQKIVVSDLSNIEGRDAAWLAGEEWKLQAFRDYDTLIGGVDAKGDPLRKGHDLYKLAYAKSFRMDAANVDDDQRQVGKVQELALGYAGGVGAFLTFSLAYNIDLEAMAEEAYGYIPSDTLEEAEGFYGWSIKKRRATFGLSERAFVTCDSFKRLWRAAHPAISSVWGELEDGARRAIKDPGHTYARGKFKFRRDGDWLRMGLPSGRCLCYPSPQVSEGDEISYMGVNQYTRQWQRVKTYGGKLFENACQALARDVMAANMPAIKKAGYSIRLTVHDEVICYAPDSKEFNAAHLSRLLSRNPEWALDMPLAAAGFESYRYKKE